MTRSDDGDDELVRSARSVTVAGVAVIVFAGLKLIWMFWLGHPPIWVIGPTALAVAGGLAATLVGKGIERRAKREKALLAELSQRLRS